MNIRWLAIRDKLIRLIKRKSPLTPEIETSSNPEKDDNDPVPILNYFLVLAKYHENDYFVIIKEEGNFDCIYILGRKFPFKKNIGIYTLHQIINTVENDDSVPKIIDWREVLQRVTSGYKILKEYNIK